MERAGDDLQLPYEAYAAGEPCRARGRALLGEPALGTDKESRARIDADNAEFRAEHTTRNMGVLRLQGNRVEHCHLCCPFPPLSPAQRDELRQLPYPPSSHIDRSATWRVELTCQHVETLATHSPRYVEPTVQRTECAVIRGVVQAVRIDDQVKTVTTAATSRASSPTINDSRMSNGAGSSTSFTQKMALAAGDHALTYARLSTRLSTRPAPAPRGANCQQSSGHGRPPCAGTAN